MFGCHAKAESIRIGKQRLMLKTAKVLEDASTADEEVDFALFGRPSTALMTPQNGNCGEGEAYSKMCLET